MSTTNSNTCSIISIVNQKGGVGKTTTSINLAQALRIKGRTVLVVDIDPQANATQGMGVKLEDIETSVADLIRDPALDTLEALYGGGDASGIPDLIPSSPLLSKVEREMIGETNSELFVAHRLNKLRKSYDVIIIDTPPTFGPLMNSALNSADELIIPVDAGYFALMGIKEMLARIQAIRSFTNQSLRVLGYLLTLADKTKMTEETWESMVDAFDAQVFQTRIRRSVKLREAPAIGKTIFHHDPEGAGADDYSSLAEETLSRLYSQSNESTRATSPSAPILQIVEGVNHG